MRIEGLLPIGSVVMLAGGTQRVMITGYCQLRADRQKLYDYCGCLFPQGMMSADQNYLFNQEQIDRIDALGFIDPESGEFLAKAEKSLVEVRARFEAGELLE